MMRRGLRGRPEVGPSFSVRFPAEVLRQIDDAALAEKTTRASWLRRAAQDRLGISREELARFVLWLLDDQSVDHSEVARVIKKPSNYDDWLEVYRAGGSLDETEFSKRFARRMLSDVVPETSGAPTIPGVVFGREADPRPGQRHEFILEVAGHFLVYEDGSVYQLDLTGPDPAWAELRPPVRLVRLKPPE